MTSQDPYTPGMHFAEPDAPRHVAMVATECFPFVKVGGLADVIGSLPKALEKLGTRVEVVLPCFPSTGGTWTPENDLEPLRVRMNGAVRATSIHSTSLPHSGVRVLIIDDGHFFPRPGVYVDPATGGDYADQADRWIFFQQAALTLLERECPGVDLIHCHEHQTALLPTYLDHAWRPRNVFRHTPTVLTIHNLGYQGVFPLEVSRRLDLPPDLARPGGPLEFYDQVNFMKSGIQSADALTVVSPTYAQEIQSQEFGYGLEGVIAERRDDLFGILNGIDDTVWDPQTDTHIRNRYSVSDPEGKQANRRDLADTLGLTGTADDAPIMAMVSRIDAHKGFDLILSVLDDLLGYDLRFVLVGTGDRAIEAEIARIAAAHPDKAAVRFAFDDTLAHRVIAGADMFLMPSRYEPCGLTQMYALRYGTVPIVRATGGLADTVSEFVPQTGEGTGFRFRDYTPRAFRDAIDRARTAWGSPGWKTLVANGMRSDFSWRASAEEYLKIYDYAIRKRTGPDYS